MHLIRTAFAGFLCIFFIFNCGKDKKTNSPTINDGLLAYYPLDGNANDTSGNRKNGVLQGQYEVAQGIKNQAIRLIAHGIDDSLGGHVLLPNLHFTEMPHFSYSFWVNEDSIINLVTNYIYFRDDPNSVPYAGIAHSLATDTIYFDVGANTGSIGLRVPYSDTYTNHFVHYCLVYDSGTVKGYINGALVGQKAQMAIVDGIYSAIARAWYSDRTSTRFTGVIDELRIYNRALSDSEVHTLYLEGGQGMQ